MTAAQELRDLARPEVAAAITAGADALDEVARLNATVAGLETSLSAATIARDAALGVVAQRDADIAALKKRIAELEGGPTETTGRFPGDPGPGKVIVGLATTRGDLTQLQQREQALGSGLAFRVYDNGGIGDLAVPGGPIAKKVLRDHAAGRITVCSPKPGIEALAAHRHETELVAFFRWLEQQPGVTYVTVHHEPENDWTADHGNLPAMAKHAADYREAQRWVRACLNKAAGGKPKRTVFIGSLLTYSWTAQGKAKFGPVDQWNPGLQADGAHVWDMAGGDHYEPAYTAGSLDTLKWRDFVASVKSWGCLPAITELGINNGNAKGGQVLAAFLKKLVGYGVPLVLYFDSKAGQGGALQSNPKDWWLLTDANGTLPAFAEFAKAVGVNPNA